MKDPLIKSKIWTNWDSDRFRWFISSNITDSMFNKMILVIDFSWDISIVANDVIFDKLRLIPGGIGTKFLSKEKNCGNKSIIKSHV